MHPYLFPWVLSPAVLTVLAYLGVAIVAAGLAWFATGRGIQAQPGRALTVFIGACVVGAWLVATKLGAIQAQPLPIHTYGLMIAVGFLSAIHLSARSAQAYATADGRSFFLPGAPAFAAAAKEASKGGDAAAIMGRKAKENVLDLAFWVFLGAMVGSRVLFIVVNWGGPDGYGANPGRIFQIWVGGFVFYGGFIGAALASVIYARKHRIDFRGLADIAAPTVALGHFFGRLGCMSAGCCWGKVASDPDYVLGAKFPSGAMAYNEMLGDPQYHDYIVAHGHTPPLHPTQMYEGVGELALFFLLIYMRSNKRFQGQIMASWLMLYAILRLSIETFRGDFGRGMLLRWPEADPLLLSTSQIVGVGMFLIGATLFVLWKPRTLATGTDAGTPTPSAA